MTIRSEDWDFETERLRLVGWRSRGDAHLSTFLRSALTPQVTRELPPSWHTPLTRKNVARWIAQRDAEGTLLLIENKRDGAPLGLFMLFVGDEAQPSPEARLGYVLAEQAWGQGYATEVLEAFVQHWDALSPGTPLLAGVAEAHTASRRVLEKAGFEQSSVHDGVLEYRRVTTTAPS